MSPVTDFSRRVRTLSKVRELWVEKPRLEAWLLLTSRSTSPVSKLEYYINKVIFFLNQKENKTSSFLQFMVFKHGQQGFISPWSAHLRCRNILKVKVLHTLSSLLLFVFCFFFFPQNNTIQDLRGEKKKWSPLGECSNPVPRLTVKLWVLTDASQAFWHWCHFRPASPLSAQDAFVFALVSSARNWT